MICGDSVNYNSFTVQKNVLLLFKGQRGEILDFKFVYQVFRSILHLNICIIRYNNAFKLITI